MSANLHQNYPIQQR